MGKLQIPTRTETQFNEVRGENREVEVQDRPFRLLERQWNELKGIYEDVEKPLTDYEILEAGGLQVFFKDDGSRIDANWPWSGADKRPKKAAKKVPTKKKVAKKKAKKRVSKK